MFHIELIVVLRLEELREEGDVCKVVVFAKSEVTVSLDGKSVDIELVVGIGL